MLIPEIHMMIYYLKQLFEANEIYNIKKISLSIAIMYKNKIKKL